MEEGCDAWILNLWRMAKGLPRPDRKAQFASEAAVALLARQLVEFGDDELVAIWTVSLVPAMDWCLGHPHHLSTTLGCQTNASQLLTESQSSVRCLLQPAR